MELALSDRPEERGIGRGEEEEVKEEEEEREAHGSPAGQAEGRM